MQLLGISFYDVCYLPSKDLGLLWKWSLLTLIGSDGGQGSSTLKFSGRGFWFIVACQQYAVQLEKVKYSKASGSREEDVKVDMTSKMTLTAPKDYTVSSGSFNAPLLCTRAKRIPRIQQWKR